MRQAGWTVAVAVCALYACPSNSPSGTAQHRAVSVGIPATSVDAGVLATAAGAAPAPQTCPSVAPVFCDAGCCGGGTSCGDAGNCAASSSAAACPSEAPVVCSTPVDCGAGCVAIDSSGNSRNFFLAPPAQFVPGKYGTGVSIRGASGCPLDLITSDAGLSDPLTIELWIRNDGGATGQVIYNHGPNRVLSQTGSTLYWADNGVGLTSYAPINDGAWHFVAATAAPRALFVDGVLRGTNPTGANDNKQIRPERINCLQELQISLAQPGLNMHEGTE